jgi:hypothetical protein
MTHVNKFRFLLAALLALTFGMPCANSSVKRTPQATSRDAYNRAGLDSSYTTTGTAPAGVDPRYYNNSTNGMTPNAASPYRIQQKPNLLISTGSFLFELFTGKGNQSFTDQLFGFIGSRLFTPIKNSFSGAAANYGGLGNLNPAAVASMSPYQNLICPTCDNNQPYTNQNANQYADRNSTQDILNYIQTGNRNTGRR